MNINAAKAKFISFNQNSSHYPSFVSNSTSATQMPSYKYLRVMFSEDVAWNSHIEAKTNKAGKALCYLRNLYAAPSNVKLMVYDSFVRPQLEYGNIIWNPLQTCLINALEFIQS